MQQARALTRDTLVAAAKTLARRDPDLADLLGRHGVPPMWGRRPGFACLVQIILEQQVSLVAARTLYLRLVRVAGSVTPEAILQLGEDGLRNAGLTRQKASYCVGLAQKLLRQEIDLSAIAGGEDGAGREQLLAVPGLGPWTVDVYYLMALRRPDVWPQGDLALAIALKRAKRLRERPDATRQRAITKAWAPWRSVAARLLWQAYLAHRSGNPI